MAVAFKKFALSAIGITVASVLTLLFSLPMTWALPIGLVGFLGLPGLLLLLALNPKSKPTTSSFVYAVSLGLAFWLGAGLILNTFLPLIHIDHPLAPLPLAATYTVVNLLLLYLLKRRYRPISVSFKPKKLELIMGAAALMLPLLSTLGATMLNNNLANPLVIIMISATVAYAIAVVALHKRLSPWNYAFALFCIALALLLMYSLRSWHILGWDIHKEYEVFQATSQHLRWQMSDFPGDAYNACLSLTILPTILQSFTHASSEYVYKLIMQIIFACAPLTVYAIASKYLSPPKAFLAGFLWVAQPWFYEQMPALIRQEIAFIFLGAIILVLLDGRLPSRTRATLYTIFTFGLVVSHYTTSYTWVALLAVTLVLTRLIRFILPQPRRLPGYIKFRMLALTVIMVVIWQGGITRAVAATNVSDGSKLNFISSLSLGSIEESLKRAFLTGGNPTSDAVLKQAYKDYANDYKEAGYSLYPPSTYSGYAPGVAAKSSTPQPNSSFVRALLLASAVGKLLAIMVLPAAGLIFMIRALRRKIRLDNGLTELTALMLGAGALIALVLLVPYLQLNYDLSRLYEQMLMILGIAAVIGISTLRVGTDRIRLLALAGLLSLIFFVAAGPFHGPNKTTLVPQSQADDSFYVYDSELSAISWLKTNRTPGAPIYGDALSALRLQSYASITALDVAFPSTISTDGYVFVDHTNITDHEGQLRYVNASNDTLTYNYPLNFLDQNKDEIYNSGNARIYR